MGSKLASRNDPPNHLLLSASFGLKTCQPKWSSKSLAAVGHLLAQNLPAEIILQSTCCCRPPLGSTLASRNDPPNHLLLSASFGLKTCQPKWSSKSLAAVGHPWAQNLPAEMILQITCCCRLPLGSKLASRNGPPNHLLLSATFGLKLARRNALPNH